MLAAERAVIDASFQDSRPAYLAALRQAHAGVGIAEAIIAEELRRAALEKGLPARAPTATDVETFYASYPHLLVRLVQASPAPSWLGGKARGLAISEVAPSRLFTLPVGQKTVVSTLEGSFTVTALDEALPLGAVSLSRARTAITAALRGFARGQAFEQWTIARQHAALGKTTCLRDQLPQPGALDLVEYLPFLRVSG